MVQLTVVIFIGLSLSLSGRIARSRVSEISFVTFLCLYDLGPKPIVRIGFIGSLDQY